jgi:5-formyltetrahydrofolate cyclo-ligase
MSSSASDTDRRRLRRELKAKRNSLNREQISSSTSRIAKNLWGSGLLARAQNVAVYLAMPGEVDCLNIVEGARLRKMRIFAPILRDQKLLFAPIERRAKLYKNRYDIAEPAVSANKYIQPQNLDAVIVPLLSFDKDGNRMGMGGGFYDRSFAFRKRRGNWKRPLLIGAAYSFQQVDRLIAESWDVPLDIVITEQKILKNS